MEKIKFSKSFEEFITQTKEESKVSKLLHYYIREAHPAVVRNFTSEKMNYLTFRKDGTISYLPYGRELKLTDSGEWSRDGRQDGKPAKTIINIMRSAALKSVSGRDLEIFSNLYKGRATDMYTIKEARGEELIRVYNLNEGGFSSCMTGAVNKIKLYANNPDVVGVLYLQSGNTCIARALVWTDMDGNVIVDRVYGSEEFRAMFRDYAIEIGAYKKTSDSAGESSFYDPKGETTWKTFYIKLKKDADYYPYVDTFCYFDDDDMTLCNDQGDATRKLQCTDGSYEDLRGVECYGRRGTYSEDDCRWSEYHDAYIHEDEATYVNDDYYYAPLGSTEDAIRIGRNNYILIDNCTEVEVFNGDDHDGICEYDDVCTWTAYKTPDGDYISKDDAKEVTVFVIDGEIIGEV